MKIKKVIAVTIVTLFAVSLTTACTKDSKKMNSSNNQKDKMTITWMGPPYSPSAKEGTFPEKLLEEKFNIDIKPIFLDNQAYQTKKPIMLASNEIPDIIYEFDPVSNLIVNVLGQH